MKTSLIKVAAAAAATSFLGLATVAPSVPAYATTKTIVGQGSYVCQSKGDGFPMETYLVTLRMSLKAPASVTPGQSVTLSGTATIQFPEKAYQTGKQWGVTEADGYSNTLSVATTSNATTTDVPANRWQTAPFPWRNPVVISAPITLHPFTVRANATGSMTITLPRNERRAPNLASKSPATVAFNGVANNKTAMGNVSENLGCYLDGESPSTIGTIPIATRASTSGASTSDASTAGTGPGSPGIPAAQGGPNGAAEQPAAGDAPAAAPEAPVDGAEPPPGASGTGAANDANAALTQGVSATPGTTRSGVFVPTDVLILAGGLICFLALGYALLTQHRLRSIMRAMDG